VVGGEKFVKEEISSTRKYYTSARTTLGLWTDEAGGRKGRQEGKRVGLGRKGAVAAEDEGPCELQEGGRKEELVRVSRPPKTYAKWILSPGFIILGSKRRLYLACNFAARIPAQAWGTG